jgi:threonine dehydrogenase-like Zn-dependent dehydrogenase
MSGNRGVVYLGAGKVEVQKIDYPKMQDPRGRKIEHGVILKVISTNICGSDQHMVRGRTTAQTDLVGVQVISLDQAPEGYGEFDAGVPKKFVIDPHTSFSMP